MDNFQQEIENSACFEALDLQGIYQQLASADKTNFDQTNDDVFALQCLEACFDQKSKLQDSDELLKSPVKFNNEFIKLVKFAQDKNFKKIHILFITFCDYYNIDYSRSFQTLHEKLQKLVKVGYAKMIGRDTYQRMRRKYSSAPMQGTHATLFDLVRNKK